MLSKEEIEKLAHLARLGLTEEEVFSLGKEIEGVLGYVSVLQSVSANLPKQYTPLPHEPKNIMREDNDGHEPGVYSEKILNEAPKREGDYFAVQGMF